MAQQSLLDLWLHEKIAKADSRQTSSSSEQRNLSTDSPASSAAVEDLLAAESAELESEDEIEQLAESEPPVTVNINCNAIIKSADIINDLIKIMSNQLLRKFC